MIHNLLFRGNKGQLLIEAMIAIAVVVVGMLGILAFLLQSLSLNRVVSDQFTGAYLASEGIELTKNILDSNLIAPHAGPWNVGFNSGDYEIDYQDTSLVGNTATGRNLLYDSGTHLYGYKSGNPTPFERKITIKVISGDEIQVNSVVSWTTLGGGNFSVNLEDHFFNWRS